ncbi:response regulator transcription factor [Salinibacterium sp. ZJ454]|uniref:response regulator transcription factor n=1 Tax=Salinibacterium sp. ZJ454 TaxID=2708339 RepID=UPI00142079D1|nr:response regulator transcription factor [Salinibacterium sp. ZJ454]
MIRIIIADDEELIRTAIVALLDLEEDLTVVAQTDNGDDAYTLAAEHKPDIVLVDLEMPPTDGIYAAERILANVGSKVILITRHARPGVLKRALASGVAGFVPKSTPVSALAAVIRSIAAGKRYVDPNIAAAALAADRCPLTPRELDTLRMTKQNASVQHIAHTLHLAEGTVRNYLSTAMAKLDAPSRHAAADIAWENGWI